MSSNLARILVHTGGKVRNEVDGPHYDGGSTIILLLGRGIGIDELRQRVRFAANVQDQNMTITFRYPVLSFPHTHYTYAALNLVDDATVDVMFELAQTICGYTPEIYIESRVRRQRLFPCEDISMVGGDMTRTISATDVPIFEQSTQHCATYNEGPPMSPPALDQLVMGSDNVEIDVDTSDEDVDAGLEADVGVNNDEDFDLSIPPSQIFTQDTWTNIVDPSPTLQDMNITGWDKRSELHKGMVFHSKVALQGAVKLYNMSQNHIAKVSESNTKSISYECSNRDPCSWRLRAHSKPKEGGIWIISKYAGPHTCVTVSMTTDHPMLDAKFILNFIRAVVQSDPAIKIKTLIETIKKDCGGYEASYAKCWAAKQKAIAAIYGDWDESYNLLEQFFSEVALANPGTVWRLETENGPTRGGGRIPFDRVFWAFGPCIEAFKHCRPVLCADGTFMSGKYKHTLLIVLTQDAQNSLLPVAFAIVESESTDTWGWFLRQIRAYVTDRPGICLISDRQSGLQSYVCTDPEWRPPQAYHRYCSRHIGANFAKKFGMRIGDRVKAAANQLQVSKFQRSLEEIRPLEKGKIGKILDKMDKEKWTFAYDGGRRYGSMTTNVSECFNGVMKDARHLPIKAAVTVTLYKCIGYFCEKGEINTTKDVVGQVFSDFAIDLLKKWSEKARYHRVIEYNRVDGTFEVISSVDPTSPSKGSRKQTVKLHQRSCTCQKWDQWKIPCSHAIASCNKMSLNHLNYVDPMWTIKRDIETYTTLTFTPIRDPSYWPPYTGVSIFPPMHCERRKGRSKTRRMNSAGMDFHESRPSEVQNCKMCGLPGHNRRTCKANRIGPDPSN